VAPEAWSWAALGGWGAVAARVSSGGWRWEMELTVGARLTGDEGEAVGSEGTNQTGKRISREDATDARAGWADRDGFGLRGRHGQWAGWARGRVGRKVGRAEIKKRISKLKIGFF
jgi:hypothetical protein